MDSVSVSAPSRGLDRQPNRYAVDDQMLGRKYRGVLQSIGNYPGSSLTLNPSHFLSTQTYMYMYMCRYLLSAVIFFTMF